MANMRVFQIQKNEILIINDDKQYKINNAQKQ